ncbi:MAG: AAA family ATPase [Gammaproteobacteria bacterium]|nr:AAA family ATPase [Gammaproteobacteria bacterium]
MRDDDLLGISEIAKIAGVSRQAVANWRRRCSDFPSPIAELASGPIFRRSHVRVWLRRREIPMPDVFSTINLKGGVGKTTTTVALAEFMSGRLDKRVLVIDLDPQTNATVMLIGEEKWRELNEREWTLARLFKDSLDPDNKRFDLDKTLQAAVSNVSEARTIDLLPSSLDLIDVQDRLATVPSGRFYAVNPTELLWRAVKSRLDDYDIVIVDCPPNLGIITLNGLRISRGFIIPTIPDVLSTYGIPQILKRVSQFSSEIAENIEPLGIIITKYQANSTVHRNTIKRLRANGAPGVFESMVPQANQFAGAAEHGGRMTLKQKWGYQGLADHFERLSREVSDALEG